MEFVSDHTVRIRIETGKVGAHDRESLMLVNQPPYNSNAWRWPKPVRATPTKASTELPHIKLAQTTQNMDWSELDLVVYSTDQD